MKKSLIVLLALLICIAIIPVSAPAGAAANWITLPFNPADAASNEDGSVVYMSDRAGKKVYSVNTSTFEQKSLSFELMPESMFYKEGRLYVSLCKQAHSNTWWTEDQSGAFAVIDCATFTVSAQHNINIDPYDIVVSNDDNIYIASGSGQWTSILGYSREGDLIARGQIRQQSTIQYNSQYNKIYSITSDSSPRNMSAYVLNENGSFYDTGGNMGTSYNWPYHGAFQSSTDFRISPDGRYIFNFYGYLADCTADRTGDMVKGRELNGGFNDVAFDLLNNTFYIAGTNRMIHSFTYNSFSPLSTFLVETGIPARVFLTENSIIALTKSANNVYCIERISKSSAVAPNTDNDYGIAFKSEVSAAVYSPLTHKTYMIDKGSRELMVFDHTTEAIESIVALSARPDGINLSADGSHIWIVNDNSSYLATEYDIYTLEQSRVIEYTVPVNCDAVVCHRHIVNGAGKLFISDGQWEPQIYVFDEHTLEPISNYGVLPGIGGMYIDQAQRYLYTWYQYGWSAGYAGSRIYKYDITGARALQVDQFEPASYTTLSRDPMDSPFLMAGDKLILKGKMFNTANLSSYSNMFPETVYAIDPVKGVAAGFRGIYSISTGMLIRQTNFSGSNAIVFDRNGDLFFSKNGTMLRYKAAAINVNAANQLLASGETKQVIVKAIFTDGCTGDVTTECSFSSSSPEVASVSAGGLVKAVGSGSSTITVSYEELSVSFIVGVNIDVTNIEVEGYAINFSPAVTSYNVMLPGGTTQAPEVSCTAPAGVKTIVTQAAGVPGTATVVVTDSDGIFSKTYIIRFFVSQIQNNEKPYIIEGVYTRENGFIFLDLWLIDNPDYYGAAPGEYSLVIQLMTMDFEPVLVSALSNTKQVSNVFSGEYLAIIMVVDRFGQRDYIGVMLADPKIAGADAFLP